MGLRRKGEILSLSESVGVHQRWSDDVENVEDDEDEAQRCLGPEDVYIQTGGQGRIHVGSYTMRTGVQEQTLKQSTYQIPRSFTTCACAIFMGQRSNNKNEPCGSWVLSQWLIRTEGAGRGDIRTKVRGVRRTVERSPRGVRSGGHRVVPERMG